MIETSKSRRYLIGGGAAACAVCCAPPVLTLIGIAGVGVVATVATFVLAGLVFATVVAALSISGLFVRRQAHARRTGDAKISQ